MFFKKKLLLDDIEPTMRLRKQSIFHQFDSVELKKTNYTLESIDNMKNEYKAKYFYNHIITFQFLITSIVTDMVLHHQNIAGSRSPIKKSFLNTEKFIIFSFMITLGFGKYFFPRFNPKEQTALYMQTCDWIFSDFPSITKMLSKRHIKVYKKIKRNKLKEMEQFGENIYDFTHNIAAPNWKIPSVRKEKLHHYKSQLINKYISEEI